MKVKNKEFQNFLLFYVLLLYKKKLLDVFQ